MIMPSVFSRRPVPLATTVCGVTDSLPFLIVPDSLSGLGQGLPPSAVRHYCSSFYLFFYFLFFLFFYQMRVIDRINMAPRI